MVTYDELLANARNAIKITENAIAEERVRLAEERKAAAEAAVALEKAKKEVLARSGKVNAYLEEAKRNFSKEIEELKATYTELEEELKSEWVEEQLDIKAGDIKNAEDVKGAIQQVKQEEGYVRDRLAKLIHLSLFYTDEAERLVSQGNAQGAIDRIVYIENLVKESRALEDYLSRVTSYREMINERRRKIETVRIAGAEQAAADIGEIEKTLNRIASGAAKAPPKVRQQVDIDIIIAKEYLTKAAAALERGSLAVAEKLIMDAENIFRRLAEMGRGTSQATQAQLALAEADKLRKRLDKLRAKT